MPVLRIDSKIVEYPWYISELPIKNLIPLSEMSLEISYQASEILFFRTVIEGKDDKVRGNKENNEEDLQTHETSQSFESNFNRME
jgi:hypothetical protein